MKYKLNSKKTFCISILIIFLLLVLSLYFFILGEIEDRNNKDNIKIVDCYDRNDNKIIGVECEGTKINIFTILSYSILFVIIFFGLIYFLTFAFNIDLINGEGKR